ncbi:hypothetical protein IKG50_02375 [Candidatus Saccharibacteria bacterium]|nr:hypothetical protein [Candidatus Saccharibacteria bacterium]
MSKVKTIFLATLASVVFASISHAAFAAEKEFTVEVNSSVSGTDTSIEYLLKSIDGEIVSRKSGASGKISFDPLTFDDSDSSSHFYTITQNNIGTPGLTYDDKIVYVRIVPSRNLIAYQDDTSYKTINDGSGPHPYRATDEEMQGQAYAVFDSKTKTLTFFRDEEGKYADGYAERIMDGEETQYRQYFTGFELANKDHPDNYGAVRPSWGYNCTKNVEFRDPYFFRYCEVASATEKVIFEDAIRPEGAMADWFYYFKNVVTADIGKLDTSRATSMQKFFQYAEKLENIDITHMDFRKATETAATTGEASFYYFLNHSPNALQELDFRNFDIVDMAGEFPLGEAFWGAGLRYLNTTTLSAGGASQDFNGNYCLERLVVGDKYSFYRSNLDLEIINGRITTTSGWLKIETGEVNSANNMIPYDHDTYRGDPNPNAKGNYVRPTCNTTPSVFASSYVKPAEIPGEKQDTSQDVKNPNTSDNITVFVTMLTIGGTVAALILRTKRR